MGRRHRCRLVLRPKIARIRSSHFYDDKYYLGEQLRLCVGRHHLLRGWDGLFCLQPFRLLLWVILIYEGLFNTVFWLLTSNCFGELNLNLCMNGLLDVVRDPCGLFIELLDHVGDVGCDVIDACCVGIDGLGVLLISFPNTTC